MQAAIIIDANDSLNYSILSIYSILYVLHHTQIDVILRFM
jgi:hypothetical protein